MNEKQKRIFWFIMWFILGIGTLIIGPTRITYGCIWFVFLSNLLFDIVFGNDDGDPPAIA